MSRIVSVWLKAWPIARLLSAQASGASADAILDPRRPLVLVAPAKGGTRIVSLNRAAQRAGLAQDVLLSNARSKVLNLQVRDADPVADSDALRRLALWCLRYTPKVAPWDEASGADGLFLDIEGCAHLFGGEERLLADLAARLKAFRLVARMAIADTAGTAWAVAHHSAQDGIIVASGEEMRVLRALPLAALRLGEESQRLMHRLGLRRIGAILHQPRAPFAARFRAELLRRLDQALGHAPEPLIPIVEPPVYFAQACFAEPITVQEHVLQAAIHLLEVLARDLERDAVGIRLLRLLLFRVDGEVQSLELGLAAPSRDAQHIAQLIGLRLYRLGNELEADFGFEAAAVHVRNAESLAERQASLGLHEDGASPEELARLIDRLQQRLGRTAVRQLHPRQSHTPERAVCVRPASPSARLLSAPPSHKPAMSIQRKQRAGRGEAKRQISTPAQMTDPHHRLRPDEAWTETIAAPRPLLLLERPEPADVLAVVPDGPPRHIRWRGVLHQIVQSQGPERIAPEWWRHTAEGTRDYYLLEDAQGRRFWLYREGLYEQGATPQWFVHGMFA
ncbi:MAG TPA: DNA polymerase Y family protein [Hyphomicrobiaceae bacterium]